MSGLNRSHTNLTVEWQPTPSDLPTSYNVSQKSQLCKPDPDHNISNMTNSLIIADWEDPIADTDSVCTIANTSYVYPCCQAIKGDARLTCYTTACRLPTSAEDQWSECAVKLADQVNDSTPLTNCQPGELINANRERNRNRTTVDRDGSAQNRAPKRTTASLVALVMLLAVVAAMA